MTSAENPDTRGCLQRLLRMNDKHYDYLVQAVRNFASEVFGTGVLVFLGCMGVVQGLGQPGDHTGVVLSFALAVFVAIQICCHNSGGHVNPAVTVVSLFFKKLNLPMAGIYIAGQVVGGILGFGLLKFITPDGLLHVGHEKHGLCTTAVHPNMSLFQAVVTEFVLTSLLMLLVCSAWDPRNSHHDSMILKFGFGIFSLAYAGVAYTGCSMNPARSLGPAVWNNAWEHHWIYWVGPLLAAAFTGFVYTTFFCEPLHAKPTLSVQRGQVETRP